MAQVRRVSQGLAFAVKALRNPVELAKKLDPTRGFKRVSGLDSIAFLDNWQVAKSAVGTNTFRETSHSFTLVLRDFYSDILFKNADDIVELFTTRGVWISCRNVKDLDDAIARDCKWLWALSGPSRPGEMLAAGEEELSAGRQVVGARNVPRVRRQGQSVAVHARSRRGVRGQDHAAAAAGANRPV